MVDPSTDERSPSSIWSHEMGVVRPAPGELEIVRSFLSLHEHEAGSDDSMPPSQGTMRDWIRGQDLVRSADEITADDLRWALAVRVALKTKVSENEGAPRDHDAIEILNRAAKDTGLQLCFGCDENRLHTEVAGVRGAIGRVLGIAFLADLDGSFRKFHECSNPRCTSVFYDRSKNHSARWCSMSSCGNRNKVRKFRERERAASRSAPHIRPADGA